MRPIFLALLLVLTSASCSSATSASSCWEYAAEVTAMIEGGASGEELNAFIEDTEQHVAQLIMDDPDRAGPCADAVLEAVFSAAFDDIELLIDG